MLADRFAAEVVAFHVREWPFSGSDWILGGVGLVEDKNEAQQILEDAMAELRSAGVRARGTVSGGRPSDVAKDIVDTATCVGADMIVIGSHPHSSLYELFVGGIPRRVRRLSQIPVVVVPRRTSVPRGEQAHAPVRADGGGARAGVDQPAQI
jgi:nucleotide-binding universal stress UspA family protein